MRSKDGIEASERQRAIEEDASRDLQYKLAFSVSVKAPKGFQVSFEKNRNFIRWLRDRGFAIKGVSSDTYQSAQIQQDLKSDGFKTELISVDRIDNTSKMCLTGETLIATPDGSLPIKDIQAGELVYSYDEKTNKKVVATVAYSAPTAATAEYFEIETDTGNIIRCTGDHLVLTKRGYVRADALSEEDEIVLAQ